PTKQDAVAVDPASGEVTDVLDAWTDRTSELSSLPADEQVFNRRARGGIYWYRAGWNIRATVSWALGAVVGVLAVALPSYEGPLLGLTGGVDCSFLLSGLVGGAAYLLLTPRSEVLAHTTAAVDSTSTAAVKVPTD
ncbi:cytosine permease, partial [Streptomyces nigra]